MSLMVARPTWRRGRVLEPGKPQQIRLHKPHKHLPHGRATQTHAPAPAAFGPSQLRRENPRTASRHSSHATFHAKFCVHPGLTSFGAVEQFSNSRQDRMGSPGPKDGLPMLSIWTGRVVLARWCTKLQLPSVGFSWDSKRMSELPLSFQSLLRGNFAGCHAHFRRPRMSSGTSIGSANILDILGIFSDFHLFCLRCSMG